MSRLVLLVSGAAAAFATLLPAAVAALIALFDFGAHGLLGLSGTLLGVLGSWTGGTGSGLPAYRGVAIDPARAGLVSLARGLPAIAVIAFAVTRAATRAHWRLAAVCAALSVATAGLPALPGLAASLVLVVRARRPPDAARPSQIT